MATCNICGGWARKLPEHGAHNLCLERQKRGLATPSLGDMCDECGGSGHRGEGGGVMLSFDLGPAVIARSIDAQFPVCPKCEGRGFIPGPGYIKS